MGVVITPCREMAVVLVLLVVILVLVSLWRVLKKSLWVLTTGGTRSANSPFRTVFPPSPTPLVTVHQERDKVLKQSFSEEKIPDSLDAIVIGKETALWTCRKV